MSSQQFSTFNSQFTMNSQFSISKLLLQLVWKLIIENLMKIENCELKIVPAGSPR